MHESFSHDYYQVKVELDSRVNQDGPPPRFGPGMALDFLAGLSKTLPLTLGRETLPLVANEI